MRSRSIWSISAGIETFLFFAISCSAFQNSASKVTEVSCPARLMERLIIGESARRRLLRAGALVAGIVSLVPIGDPNEIAINQVRRRMGTSRAPDLKRMGLSDVAEAISPLRDWYYTKVSYQHSLEAILGN